ncbi:hypothetical protein IC582_003680 [Cucumis melo]
MTSTPSGGYCCKFSFSLKSRHFNLPNSHKSSKKLFFLCYFCGLWSGRNNKILRAIGKFVRELMGSLNFKNSSF